MKTSEMFYRINAHGDAVILTKRDGEAVTRIDASVYPIGSVVSARYEHPAGITLTVADAKSLGIDEE